MKEKKYFNFFLAETANSLTHTLFLSCINLFEIDFVHKRKLDPPRVQTRASQVLGRFELNKGEVNTNWGAVMGVKDGVK